MTLIAGVDAGHGEGYGVSMKTDVKKAVLKDAFAEHLQDIGEWLGVFYYPPSCNLKTASDRLGVGKRTLWAWLKRNGHRTKRQAECQSGKLNGFAGKTHSGATKSVIGHTSRQRQLEARRGKYGRYGDNGKHPIGPDNPTFKTGVGSYRRHASELLHSGCFICGKTISKLDIHHVDGNRHNNVSSNLAVLCTVCHAAQHPRSRGPDGRFLRGGDAICQR